MSKFARTTATFLLSVVLVSMIPLAHADGPIWEYKVVILQGVMAGGTIEKESKGVYVDIKRTEFLNDLAANGWEVVTVLGGLGTDHCVYLRRKKS